MTNYKVGFYGGKFIPFHMGHLYAITQAASMVDELYVVLCYVEERDRELCAKGKIPNIPHHIRLQWITTATKDMENVKVIEVEDYDTDDMDYNWEAGTIAIKAAIGKKIDIVFSSEHAYEDYFTRLYEGAVHHVIDAARLTVPISASKIREEGPYKNWDMIPDVAKPFFTKQVAIVGTESCGKSTVTRYLAKILQTNYVEEYGRTLCEVLGGCDGLMTEDHFQQIVFGHKYFEHQAIKQSNKVMFIDSEAVVSQYYARMYLGQECDFIESVINAQKYDLYLFLEPDVKWVDDGFRSQGSDNVRIKNNQLLKDMFTKRGIPFITISGNYQERLNNCLEEVNKLF